MSSLGTQLRLRRPRNSQGRFLLLALDHGLPAGPLPGLEDPRLLLRALQDAPLTGVVVNPGLVPHLVSRDTPLPPLVVHVSAGTLLGRPPSSKVPACSVECALALGADAVSVQIGFGDPEEGRMLGDAGHVVDEASRYGLPVLVMAYPPGSVTGTAAPDDVRHAARAAAELGADLVQVPHPGAAEDVRAVVRGCPAPVLVAGGPRSASPEALLDAAAAALAGGAAGLVVGRNLFQHPDPASFARRLGEVVSSQAPRIEIASA